MVFFPELEVNQKEDKDPSKFDWKCTEYLHQTLTNRNLIRRRRYRLKDWANKFRLLRQDFGDKPRIKKVLKWYCSNIGKQFVPEAYSAKGFRDKFLSIESAMNRVVEETPKKISKRAGKLVQDLSAFGKWPKGSDRQLPQVVEKSLHNYGLFRLRLQSVDLPMPAIDRAREQLLLSLPSPETFVRRWFEEQCRSVANWEDWNGKLRAFDPDSPKFQKQCMDIVQGYCGAADAARRLNKIMGVLNES